MIFLNLILYACLMLQILEVETNPGLQRPVPSVCRILWMSVKNISHGIHANNDFDRCSGYKIFVSSISVIHNICARFPWHQSTNVWYPRYTILSASPDAQYLSSIHNKQYLYMDDTHCLCLVLMQQNICLVSMIHNTLFWCPSYTLSALGISDTLSGICDTRHMIYVWIMFLSLYIVALIRSNFPLSN